MAPSLVWIDCEMTGLAATDKLIEIAVIITDDELNIVAEGPNLIIHQPKDTMDKMNEWCTEHHGASGLTAAVLASKVTTEDACAQVLEFIKKYIPKSRHGILAGNSVHADKEFLEREMKPIIDHLHYRIVDVSTVKELARRWYPEEFKHVPPKKMAHRALDDIKESIKELQYYRSAVFK
ncbi:Oligoribonuclease, mitochondrial [Lobosporangium transversale]|uniref:Ribonuclease H-like domain-containing protein n=1 Tax=Lobosporangium transversale TaxID=64571 RepID=A0A1Y2G921_9FUNG|nr:ribonuclease H-like domain-containing protein [Lobosporangium transversale]KAF9919075.1 Oligoribonuclease, mitochondrial [Lobosporangium transversale]ORZ04461.1 ribonuclease H-like domain-containing protein [Lobosporangium transversale]|eukprot:XP_021876569.1 ribonuclease H-like domain-containing protein [Lobosporangium transversale]